MSSLHLVDCANCGSQTEIDLERVGDTCLFCGKNARKKEDIMAEKQAVVEAVQEYNRGPVPPKPQKRAKAKAYWEKNKEDILADYGSMKLRDFFKRWHMATVVWPKLKKLWGVENKGRGSRPAKAPVVQEEKMTDQEVDVALTEHERFLVLLGYQEATREFLKILGKKLENRHE